MYQLFVVFAFVVVVSCFRWPFWLCFGALQQVLNDRLVCSLLESAYTTPLCGLRALRSFLALVVAAVR